MDLVWIIMIPFYPVVLAGKVLPIVNALLAYVPHLQALSASSPFWGGTDTGYASNRATMFAAADRRTAVPVRCLVRLREVRGRYDHRHHRQHR